MPKRVLTILSLIVTLLFPAVFSTVHAQGVPAFEGQIAFIGPDGNVWVLRGDGSTPIPVTYDANNQRRYYSPVWSVDGSRLAYCSADPAGAGVGQLFSTWSGEWLPFLVAQDVYCKDSSTGMFEWSLDGSKLLYARSFAYSATGGAVWDPYYGIWEADTVSGAQREVIPPPGENPLIYPDLSPDGRWVRFYELIYIEGLGVMRTWQMETSSMAGWLNLGGDIFPGLSSWAPDGSQLVFDQVTYTGFPGAGLYAANPDGSGAHEIFSVDDEAASHPLWSPDGQNIMFLLTSFTPAAADSARLALVDPQGQNARVVYRGPASTVPLAWSPSASQLLFGFNESDQSNLMLYDLASDTSAKIATLGDWAVSWGPLPSGPPPVTTGPADLLLDMPYSPALLLTITPDYMAVLRDPATGTQVSLTPPMTVAGFTPSPSRRSLVFGNRWLSLDFRENNKLAVHTSLLPAAPQENLVNWSPDETRLAFQAQDGVVWLVDRDGKAVQIPDAHGLPEWSYNGQWLSYCTAGDALWLVGSASPPQKIADASLCRHRWSSGQDLLAYTAITPVEGAATLRSYLFNPVTGESNPVMDGATVDSWSPDGRYLALQRLDTRGSSIFAYDPASGRQLFVGQFDNRGLGLRGWQQTDNGYFYGPYRVAADLSSATRVADSLFGASQDGNTLLIGIGSADLVTLACMTAKSGSEIDLLTLNLSKVPAVQKPGIWAQLSPDGGWVYVRAYDIAGQVLRLDSCDGSSQETLPEDKFQGDYFSMDSRWFASSQLAAEGGGQVVALDLTGVSDLEMPTIPAAPVYWLKQPVAGPPETFLINGRVTGSDGAPLPGVLILLEGEPKATTGEDGSFTISSLAPGKYAIQPQLEGAVFEPDERRVSLPPDTMNADFASDIASAAPVVSPAVGSLVTPTVAPVEPPVDEIAAVVDSYLAPYGFRYQSWMPSGAAIVCLAILGLLLVFVLTWYLIHLRRTRHARQRPPVPVSFPVAAVTAAEVKSAALPEVTDTQPVAVKGAPATPPLLEPPVQPADPVQALLREGIALVKGTELERGRQKLRQVVQLQPDNANAWLWLGWAAAQQKDLRAAERCFRRAQALGHPKAEQGLHWIGKL